MKPPEAKGEDEPKWSSLADFRTTYDARVAIIKRAGAAHPHGGHGK